MTNQKQKYKEKKIPKQFIRIWLGYKKIPDLF